MKRTTKEEVMKAALIWKAEHPYEDYIEKEVEVKLPNGVVVPLGTRLRTLKSNPKYLTKEEKEFFDTLEIRKKLYPTKNEMKQAAEIWKKDHPNETYVDKESKVTLLNGKIIEFGKGLRNIKSQINRLSENDKIFWSFYDISESPQLSEEEWREAAEIWKSEHEDAKYIPCDAEVTISSGKKVALGTRISNMRRGQVKLTDEQKEFWSSNYDALERIRICITEEEWREAARLWKEDHPKAKYIARNAQVTISSNKKVSLGTRIVYMKQHPENLTEEQKTFWNSNYNVFENVRPTEEEWKEAVEIWKRAHPNEEHIKQKEEVTISSGKKLLLGRKIAYIKKNFDKLSEQEQLFWGGEGLSTQKTNNSRKVITKEEYQEAAIIWKQNHPELEQIPQNTIITISSGKQIPLGARVSYIKSFPQRLSLEEKEFWTSYNVFEPIYPTFEEYQEAVIIWRKEHPDERSIKKSTKVIISSGKEINLGKKVDNLKYNADKLSEEERSFWEKYNVFENVRPTEEEYQEAAIIWRKEHPNDSSIKTSTKVIISSGKEINLGKRVNNLKYNAAKLSEEERYFWSEYGIFETKEERTEKKRIQYWSVDNSISPKKLTKNNKLEIVKELKVRKAFEEWKEKNPMLAATACDTKVTLPTGKVVNVRSRIINLQTLFKTGKFEMTETEIKRYWTFQRVLHRQCDNSSYQFHQQRSLADLGKEYLYRLYGKEEKVYYIIKCLKEIREKDRTLNNFVKNLKLDDESFSRGMKRLKKESEGQDKKYDFNQSISQFCATYGYKEDSLRKVISLQKVCPYDTLEQLVNRALISDKLTSPSNWIYEKYGRNIEAILEYLHLDASLILREMSQDVMTLEETIASTIFKNNNTSIKYQWVEVPFQYFKTRIDPKLSPCEISKKCSDFSKTYHMNREENILLQNCFVQYISLMQEYRKMEIGLETNEVRRYKQIQIYNFSSDDIEESFFLPLELNREKLIGKGLELYQRRSLLRQYAIDWNLYEEDEKIQLIKKEKMTKEEVSHIETIRTKIDETIENSIKTKRKII